MARGRNNNNGKKNGRRLASQQSVDQAVKGICDIMRRGNCAGAMQYVPELTWILFLRILDELDEQSAQDAKAVGVPSQPSLEPPYRWRDWAAPPEALPEGQANARAKLMSGPTYDPGCGTGGFLAQSYEHMKAQLGDEATGDQLELLKQRTFWGREKENVVYPIALANLILHGIDKPNISHGNTLTDEYIYNGLFEGAPATFDVILTNPPFGSKEGKGAQVNFEYKTSATQVLFLQHVLRILREGGAVDQNRRIHAGPSPHPARGWALWHCPRRGAAVSHQ